MKDKVIKLVGERTGLIEALNKKLEKVVGTSQRQLLELVISDFVDNLEVKDGKIVNSLKNKRLVALLDETFTKYAKDHGPVVSKTIVEGVGKVMEFNHRYFSQFDKPAKLLPLQNEVKTAVSSWLGVEKGTTARNGYLDTLIKAEAVKQEMKDLTMSQVVNQSGFAESKRAIQDFLLTSGQGTGRIMKYYRNYTFDLYSTVDRTAAKISADRLGLKYAIYEGGLIKTSRQFCKDRNGKVFTSEEIAEFDPPNAKQPDYNPATDLGGYACRHHLNYIPYAVAVALRPDLKKDNPPNPVKEVKDPAKPSPESKKIEGPAKIPPKTPFDKIPDHDPAPFKPATEQQQRLIDTFAGTQSKMKKARAATLKIEEEFKLMDEKKRQATTPEEEARLKKEDFQLGERHGEALGEEFDLQDVLDSVNELFRNSLVKDRKAEAQTPIKIAKTLENDAAFMRETGTAINFWRKAAAGWLDEVEIEINVKGGYVREQASGTEIGVNRNTRPRVIVHELSHILEQKHNQILKAAVDFLQRRTKDSKIEKLAVALPNHGYRIEEIFKRGGFYDLYVGKFYLSSTGYRGHAATEVISMGLERMYHDPLQFMRDDPEHFNLIYSLFFKD